MSKLTRSELDRVMARDRACVVCANLLDLVIYIIKVPPDRAMDSRDACRICRRCAQATRDRVLGIAGDAWEGLSITDAREGPREPIAPFDVGDYAPAHKRPLQPTFFDTME